MGILELILVLVIISAFFGRGRLALGSILDVIIALLVIVLVWRLIQVLL